MPLPKLTSLARRKAAVRIAAKLDSNTESKLNAEEVTENTQHHAQDSKPTAGESEETFGSKKGLAPSANDGGNDE